MKAEHLVYVRMFLIALVVFLATFLTISSWSWLPADPCEAVWQCARIIFITPAMAIAVLLLAWD
jgi:hypothetical protein